MTYKSEGWAWSNQTTTGCANCYYCWNGRCAYGGRCYGTEIRRMGREWVKVPIEVLKENYDKISENKNIFGDKK